MDNNRAPASARVAAANAILDRGWGRPTQAHELSTLPDHPIEVREVTDHDLARRLVYMLSSMMKTAKPAKQET